MKGDHRAGYDSKPERLNSSAESGENAERSGGEGSADREFMELARKRIELASAELKPFHDLAVEDLKFSIGDADNGYQWDERHRRLREAEGKPCLTSNRLGQFIHQITNEQRQNRPGIIVDPVDDGADIETADVFQGLIRHIESSSSAYVAYAAAGEHQVRTGVGYFRILTKFVDEEDFGGEQEISIEAIGDPLSVYFDPHTRKYDRSDAEYCFIVSKIPLAEYNRIAKGKSRGYGLDFKDFDREAPGWRTEDTVKIAEYFYVERVARTRVRLADGSKLWKDELVGDKAKRRTIVEERTIEQRQVHWCKIDGIGKLESQKWAGKWIPVIEVPGEEFIVQGRRERFGLVRMMKDPQRMFNVWRSALTETIGLAPRAPWIGAKEVFAGLEQYWGAANVKNFSHLPYNFIVKDGVQAPAPQRNFGEPPIQAITLAGQQSIDDMYGTSGIYPPSLGARSNESSGRAILARQRESDVANYHFGDNLARSIEFAGRQLVDLIPKIYDTERVIRILGEDDEPKTVRINAPFTEQKGGEAIERIYDLTVGRYDVTVRQGPSFATKRQEAADALLQLTQSDPTLMQWGGDLVFKTLDIPYADKFAERRKKMLPPELQEKEDGQPEVPPQVAAEMQQLQAQQQQLIAALEQATAEANDKSADRASKERIAEMQASVQVLEAFVKEGMAESREMWAIVRSEIAAFMQPGPVEEGPGSGTPAGA